jgi:hypothetical protein
MADDVIDFSSCSQISDAREVAAKCGIRNRDLITAGCFLIATTTFFGNILPANRKKLDMTTAMRTWLVGAALAGLLVGTNTVAGSALKGQSCVPGKPGGTPGTKGDNDSGKKATKTKKEKHTCKGQNTCKGKGGCGSTKGKNDCMGKGECRTDGKPMEKEGD